LVQLCGDHTLFFLVGSYSSALIPLDDFQGF
jgi:hypothetical protein